MNKNINNANMLYDDIDNSNKFKDYIHSDHLDKLLNPNGTLSL